MVNVKDLKLKDDNPRTISKANLERLSRSIDRDPEFMEIRPIVVDGNNIVVAGNQRLKAVQLLGMKEIPDEWVIRASELTTEKLNRFMLIDNSPDGLSGKWDWGLLVPQLKEMQSLDFQLDEIGFEGVFFEPTTPGMPPTTPQAHVDGDITPYTPPNSHDVTPEDVEKAHQRIEQRIQDGAESQRDTVEIICPYCTEAFEMEKRILRIELEKS